MQEIAVSIQQLSGLRQRILAIGAHPDDVLLGAGGYLLQLRDSGHEITVLTLTSGGLAGRCEVREQEEREAAQMCGFLLEFARLADGAIDLKAAIACIEATVDRVVPELVLTHNPLDRHQDHEVASCATMIACRPVPSIYTFEGPSCASFSPTMTINCAQTWDRKLAALECYRRQMRRRPYIEWVNAVSSYRAWPRHVGSPCEAFTAVRQDPETVPVTRRAHLAGVRTAGVETLLASHADD